MDSRPWEFNSPLAHIINTLIKIKKIKIKMKNDRHFAESRMAGIFKMLKF